MADKVVKLTLDIQTRVADLEKEMGKIQKTFNGLKGPENLTKDIKSSFTDLESRLKKVKEYTEGNQIHLVDEKKVKSELLNIEKEYNKLFKTIDRNSNKFSLASASKEGKVLQKSISEYNAKINEGTKAVKAQEAEIDKLNKKIEKANSDLTIKGQVKSNAEVRLKELNDQKDALENLIKLKKQEQENNGRTPAQNEAAIRQTKAYKELQELLPQVELAEKDLANASKEYEKQEKNTTNAINETNEAIKLEQDKLKDLNDSLSKLKTDEFQKLKNELKELQSSGEINLGFDIDAIQNVQQFEQELEKIDNQDFDQVRNYIQNLLNGLQDGAKAGKEYGEQLDRDVDAQKQLNSELEQFKSRITYFFGMNNAVRLFQRAVRSAFNTVQDLDKVMTETAVVTNFNVGDMWSQLPEYTERANALGVSIHDAYEAATLYYQQGLKTNEVMAVSNETLKMARIAGLDAADATDRMTNALRGFNMEITEANAQNINDVYSNLAAKTASNVDEISTAMTKVASLANNANMSFENTAAFLSQIIETTRESAETAGTALKTVIARFSEVKGLYSKGELLGDVEGEEIDVNKISTALRTAGINLNEYLTGMKGLDEIFMELSAKWDSLDQIQQRYIATMAAGSRQQSRFIALMQDNARMTELVSDANNAAGASQKQFEKTLDSLETKLNQLHNAWNTFLMGIANSDAIKFVVDLLTSLVNVLNKITDQLPGVAGSFVKIMTAVMLFKVGKSLFSNMLSNIGATIRGEATKSGTEAAQNWVNGFRQRINENVDGLSGEIKRLFVGFDEVGKVATLNLQNIGMAATAAGAAITTLGQAFNDGTEQGEQIANAISTVGSVVMALGGAVTALGMLANLTGIKISASAWATSANVAAAGQAAQIGWGWISLVIGAVVALGAAAVGIYQAIKANSPEAVLERAEDAAQRAEDAANDAADAYEKLGNSLDTISEKTSTLDNMTKGTKEWKEQVRSLNDEVLELKKQYNGLEVQLDSNGILRITNLDEVKKSYSTNAAINSLLSIQSQQDVIGADLNKQFSDLGRFDWRIKGMLDTFLSPGHGLGAGWGAQANGKWDTGSSRELTQEIALLAATGKSLEEVRQYAQENGIEIYLDNQTYDALKQFGNSIKDAAKEIESLNNQYKAGVIDLVEGDKSKSYAASYISGSMISETTNKNRQNMLDQLTQAAWANDLGASFNNLQNQWREQYAKMNNYSSYAAWKRANNGDIELNELITALSSLQTTTDLLKDTNEFIEKLNETNDKRLTRAYSDSSGKNLIQSDIDQYKENSSAFIQSLYEELYDEYDAHRYAEFAKQTRAIYNEGLAYFNGANGVFEKFGVNVSNLAVGGMADLAKQFEVVARYSGEGVAKELAKSFNELSESMGWNEQETAQFANALSLIDWTNADAADSFGETLKSLGIEIDTNDTEFQEFIVRLKEGAGAIKSINFDNVIEQVSSLLQILGEFDNEKISFSEEDYLNITQDNTKLASDFVKDVFTGEYVYVGESMEDLKSAIQENTKAILDASAEQLDAQVKAGDIVKDIGGLNTDEDLKQFLTQARGKGILSQLGLGISDKTDWSDIGRDQNFARSVMEKLNGMYDKLDENVGLLEQQSTDQELFKYQTNSVGANVALAQGGNQTAGKVLQSQARQSGVSLSTISSLGTDFMQLAQITEVFKQASQKEIDISTLNEYIETLHKTTTGLTEFQIAQKAMLETLADTGLQQLASSYDDWKGLIDSTNGIIKATGAVDTQVLNSMVDSLATMLNTTPEIAKGMLNTKENVDLLITAVTQPGGAQEAFDKLAETAHNIEIETQVKTTEDELTKVVNELVDGVDPDNIVVSADIDTTMFATKLREMIGAANVAGSKIAQILNSIGGYDASTAKSLLDYKSGKFQLPENAMTYDENGKVVEASLENIVKQLKVLGANINKPVNQISRELAKNGETWADYLGKYEEQLKDIVIFTKEPEVTVDQVNTSVDISPNSAAQWAQANADSSKVEEDTGPKYELWQQAYDELYAWQLKINTQIRTRKRLERDYQDILRSSSSSAQEIRDGYKAQVGSLRQEAQLQRELLYLAEHKAETLGKSYFLDSQGNYRTYEEMGVDKMISYDSATHMIGDPDWKRINAIADADTRAALLEYNDKLQELVRTAQSAEDAIYDIEDELYDLQQQAIDSYVSFEERVMSAVQDKYTKQIDELEKINENLEDMASDLIKSIQEQIAEQRRQRDNAKTEEGIADKEARLAYLSRDTSGANDLEVLKLQKEIEEARLSYEDRLIDQALDQMQKEADLAAEQRAEQIQLMRDQLQNQINTGALWEEVYALINGAMGDGELANSDLVALLKESEAFESMSTFGQGTWFEKLAESFNNAIAGLTAGGAQFAGDAYNRVVERLDPFMQPDERQALLDKVGELGFEDDKLIVVDENTSDQLDTISNKMDTIAGLIREKNEGDNPSGEDISGSGNKLQVQPSGTAAQGALLEANAAKAEAEKQAKLNAQLKAIEQEKANNAYLQQQLDGWTVWYIDPKTNKSVATGSSLYGYLYNGQLMSGAYARYGNDNVAVKAEDIGKKSWLKDISTLASIKTNFGVDAWNFMKGVKAYAKGGLADFTGPAWLDGTKSNPELVLNAADTKNFLVLRDILGQLLDNTSGGTSNTSYGDTYYDIDINAEIGSDYDVDQLADRIKSQIVQDGQYRNVNSISFMR